ncbi:MAG: hypothetical protein O3C32_09725 [Bacteroidetes bacterium]|nr:hypothetical protein [Bacteroidota bacterium]
MAVKVPNQPNIWLEGWCSDLGIEGAAGGIEQGCPQSRSPAWALAMPGDLGSHGRAAAQGPLDADYL